MVNYGEAIKKPFADIVKYIIGIVLSIIPIVSFIVTGYVLEIAKKTMKKDNSLPEWSGLGAMWVKGLLVFIISLIYLIPTGILMVLGAISMGIFALVQGMTMPILGAAFLILGGIAGIVTLIIMPMAIMNYAKTDNFGAAFNIGLALRKGFTGTNIITLIILFAISIVIGVLTLIPILGQVIALIAGFFMYVAGGTMLAEVYVETP